MSLRDEEVYFFEQVRRAASQIATLVDSLVVVVEGLPQAPPLAASTASAGAPPAAAAVANNTSDPNTWKVAMARFRRASCSPPRRRSRRRSPTPSSARATGTSVIDTQNPAEQRGKSPPKKPPRHAIAFADPERGENSLFRSGLTFPQL